MVRSHADVNEILDNGIFGNAKKGTFIIDSSTILPNAAKLIHEKCK